VQYWDGQFNDARLALAIGRTAVTRGALLVNYCAATGLLYEGGKISGVLAQDSLSGKDYRVRSRCVVNATGVWVDALREMDSPAHSAAGGRAVEPMVAPSQGVHIVVDRKFLDSDTALMVPKTSDGRVLFAVPWLGKVILGTTDTPRNDLAREPLAFAEEVEFILRESARYLRKAPTRADIKSIWVGLRPLVKPQDDDAESTKALSREHTVIVSRTGLVTVTGGKWTTYRAMAEDVLDMCAAKGLLERRAAGQTADLRLVGAQFGPEFSPVSVSQAEGEHSYGSEMQILAGLPGADVALTAGLTDSPPASSASTAPPAPAGRRLRFPSSPPSGASSGFVDLLQVFGRAGVEVFGLGAVARPSSASPRPAARASTSLRSRWSRRPPCRCPRCRCARRGRPPSWRLPAGPRRWCAGRRSA
jgi:glycerol-3-phosphate dehydrogenase